jgi:hypothetical protein
MTRKGPTPKKRSPAPLDDHLQIGGPGTDAPDVGYMLSTVTGAGDLPAAFFMPGSVRGLSTEQGQAAANLQHQVLHLREVQSAIDQSVDELRAAGASWGVIGWCVGTTADAARRRWSH